MKSNDKRATRRKLQLQRLNILARMEDLETMLKEETDPQRREEYLKEIKKCGKQLEQHVLVHVDDHPYVDVEEFKIYAKGIEHGITVTAYIELKQKGLYDKDIAKVFGITKSGIDKFKMKNQLTRSAWKGKKVDA